jgi:hypothetical protein
LLHRNSRSFADQKERINAIVERSAILDTSKFVRIAVDWLLRSDIGEVIKKIVDEGTFPDYQLPRKPAGRKKRRDEVRRSPYSQLDRDARAGGRFRKALSEAKSRHAYKRDG